MPAPGAGRLTPASSPHPVVEEAFKKFEKLVRPSDDRLFRQTTLEDVRKAAHIISRDQSQRSCLRNLNRIKPLFDLLHKLSAPIDSLCQGTPYLCYIWAPIKLILQIADEYGNSFDKLVDAYVQIAQHLPRFDRLSETFSNQADFQSVLADIYSDILEFHSAAYQFLRRGGWKTLFDASWRDFGTRFTAILRRLDQGRDLLDKEAASFNMLESKDFRQKLLEDLGRRERERIEWQMRDVLLWLDLKGQDREQDELIERRIASREPTTCTWILNNQKVSTWLEDEDSHAFLWLNGKAGSGKTTLASYLLECAAFPPKSIILYCLCSYGFGKSETNACSLTLRSLIAQIIRCRNDLLPHVYDNYVKVGITSSLPKTRTLLKDLLCACELAFLIVDGVDECEPDHQRQILSELFTLTSQNEDGNRVKILVCSRETPEIVRKLNKVPKLQLKDVKENIERDITTFTMNSLTELQDQFDEELLAEIGGEIVRKASGMFLWVQLVMTSILNQGSVHDLKRTISQLPADLPGVYKSILDGIHRSTNDHQQRRVRFVLGLLASSCRPLKAWEICDFVVFHEGADVLHHDNKLTKSVLNICKPFVEELDGETIHIIHFSAREFLFEGVSGPYLREVDVHYDIAVACVKYLLTCSLFLTRPLHTKAFGDTVQGFHDLFPYVHEFWTVHLTNAAPRAKGRLCINPPTEHMSGILDALATLARAAEKGAESPLLPQVDYSPMSHHEQHDTFLTSLQLIQQYLIYRSSLVQKQYHVVTDVECSTDAPLVDPTSLSHAYNGFVDIFEKLLARNYPQDLSIAIQQAQIDDFISRHSGSAYLCRWTGCVRASAGFATPDERIRHESSHKKLFRCPQPDCDAAVGGFTSKQALRKHKQKYHTTVADMVLPSFPSWQTKGNAGLKEDTYQDRVLANKVLDEVPGAKLKHMTNQDRSNGFNEEAIVPTPIQMPYSSSLDEQQDTQWKSKLKPEVEDKTKDNQPAESKPQAQLAQPIQSTQSTQSTQTTQNIQSAQLTQPTQNTQNTEPMYESIAATNASETHKPSMKDPPAPDDFATPTPQATPAGTNGDFNFDDSDLVSMFVEIIGDPVGDSNRDATDQKMSVSEKSEWLAPILRGSAAFGIDMPSRYRASKEYLKIGFRMEPCPLRLSTSWRGNIRDLPSKRTDWVLLFTAGLYSRLRSTKASSQALEAALYFENKVFIAEGSEALYRSECQLALDILNKDTLKPMSSELVRVVVTLAQKELAKEAQQQQALIEQQPSRLANVPWGFTREEKVIITQRAAALAKLTQFSKMRAIVTRMDPQVRANLVQKGFDPLTYHFTMLATREFRQGLL